MVQKSASSKNKRFFPFDNYYFIFFSGGLNLVLSISKWCYHLSSSSTPCDHTLFTAAFFLRECAFCCCCCWNYYIIYTCDMFTRNGPIAFFVCCSAPQANLSVCQCLLLSLSRTHLLLRSLALRIAIYLLSISFDNSQSMCTQIDTHAHIFERERVMCTLRLRRIYYTYYATRLLQPFCTHKSQWATFIR